MLKKKRMKLYNLNKCLIFGLYTVIILQMVGCCRKKTITVKKETKKIETKIEEKYEDEELTVPDDASELLNKTGLNYSIDKPSSHSHSSNSSSFAPVSFFEKRYLDGIKFMEAENYAEAKSNFQAILDEYPEGEEASIASLSIAEIFFREKNNKAALELFMEIVKKYPGTQAAQNAAEGIKYLQSFAEFEEGFVPPEQANKRRKW